MISYAAKDHSAAISDLIAIDGKVIEINGKKLTAHIIEGGNTQEASEFGLDNRDQEMTALIVNRSNDVFRINDPAIYRGKKQRVVSTDQLGDEILSITLAND